MTTDVHLHPAYIAGTWKLDLSHSEASFTVRHLMISKVRGRFNDFDVTIVTAEDPAKNSIEATIDVVSIDTGNEGRDQHLRTNDFFLAEKYPTITFSSSGGSLDGDTFDIVGDLTIRGVTKQVVLHGTFGGIITDGYGQTKAAAHASVSINRHDYGVSWNAALEAGGMTLGDTVDITLDLQVVLQ